ncbi:MAG TPA: hypothetical protein VI814_13450 [Candidatus Limnocylindria bacterium]
MNASIPASADVFAFTVESAKERRQPAGMSIRKFHCATSYPGCPGSPVEDGGADFGGDAEGDEDGDTDTDGELDATLGEGDVASGLTVSVGTGRHRAYAPIATSATAAAAMIARPLLIALQSRALDQATGR